MVANKRMARCIDCNIPLPAGSGIGNESRFNLEGIRYRCASCEEKRVSVETAWQASKVHRDRIRKLLAGATMANLIEEKVFWAVMNSGAQAQVIAQRIETDLGRLPVINYGTAMDVIRAAHS